MQKGTATKVAFCMEGSIDSDVLHLGDVGHLSGMEGSHKVILSYAIYYL
jgi:hypothetical protein